MTMLRKIYNKFGFFCRSSLRVGWFLAWRQISRLNKWSTALIVFVMTLTFLNLVFVSGILSGLVEGSSIAYRQQYSGDLILSTQESNNFINNSRDVIDILYSFPETEALTPRILSGVVVEAGYKEVGAGENPDSLSTVLAGIDPDLENRVTGLAGLVVAGSYLGPDDQNEVLVGSNLLSEYSRNVPGDETLDQVNVGSTIRLRIGDKLQEVRIKGVVKSKIGEVGQRIYMDRTYLRKLIARPNQNVNEIAVLLAYGVDPVSIKEDLKKTQVCDCAKIETWEESQGQFFKDIGRTFDLLGGLIGAIGIAVASITVFIVIFINAITRRRFIGILKGIGICGSSIQLSYIIQSLFYSLTGSFFGTVVLYGLLKPYIDRNPIDFPFSDGILVAPWEATLFRVSLLALITVLAGYIPAKIIVGKNTLNSILGR